MQNIYDIRKEKQLQFVLSTQLSPSDLTYRNKNLNTIAVIVNLFYIEKVKYYCQYLNHVPEGITLYIFSSKEETLSEAKKYLHHKNTIYLKKENRGRDLSALLVAFRPYLNNYNLVCFLHDKKAHFPWLIEDIDIWNKNLWENMISSPEYIYNILKLFERDAHLGILFPPEPLGEFKLAWFKASWNENFELCYELAKKLHLDADIRKDKPPISLGSVFWAKKDVLLKLFHINWKYEDFPEEPMSDDFTVSHAIERIFGYLAQDAGYDAGTVMTEEYASWSLLFLQEYVRIMFFELSNSRGVENFNQLRLLFAQEKNIFDYIKKHRNNLLFGAGKQGRFLLKLLREKGIEPDGFLVSDGNKQTNSIEGIRVYELKEMKSMVSEDLGIILTVYYPLQEDMINELREYGIQDYFVIFDKTL